VNSQLEFVMGCYIVITVLFVALWGVGRLVGVVRDRRDERFHAMLTMLEAPEDPTRCHRCGHSPALHVQRRSNGRYRMFCVTCERMGDEAGCVFWSTWWERLRSRMTRV